MSTEMSDFMHRLVILCTHICVLNTLVLILVAILVVTNVSGNISAITLAWLKLHIFFENMSGHISDTVDFTYCVVLV